MVVVLFGCCCCCCAAAGGDDGESGALSIGGGGGGNACCGGFLWIFWTSLLLLTIFKFVVLAALRDGGIIRVFGLFVELKFKSLPPKWAYLLLMFDDDDGDVLLSFTLAYGKLVVLP